MEVLLLQDVNGIGKKDDLLVVGDGYALNFLLPESKAMIATPTVRRRFAEQIRRRAEEAEMERMSQAQKAAEIVKKELKFAKKITKTGNLYAAITEKHIVEELKKQHKIDAAEKDVSLSAPIKATGNFDATIKFGENTEHLTITVKEEK